MVTESTTSPRGKASRLYLGPMLQRVGAHCRNAKGCQELELDYLSIDKIEDIWGSYATFSSENRSFPWTYANLRARFCSQYSVKKVEIVELNFHTTVKFIFRVTEFPYRKVQNRISFLQLLGKQIPRRVVRNFFFWWNWFSVACTQRCLCRFGAKFSL